MARTRLRGIELAGIKLAVQSPPEFEWDWPEQDLAALSVAASDPDVYVGVSVSAVNVPDWDPITYSYESGTFDIGQVDGDWVIAVHGRRHRFERVARFDKSFSVGEVAISPGAVTRCAHPLAGPLLDVILLHRVIAEGGLVLTGKAVIENGRAMAFLGFDDVETTEPAGVRSRRAGAAESRRNTPGNRFAIRIQDDQVRVHGLTGANTALEPGVSARLDAVHVVTQSRDVYADPLPAEDATTELLQYVYAPVHDPDRAESLMLAAAQLAEQVPVMRLGMPEEKRVVPFAWGQRHAALAFALPL